MQCPIAHAHASFWTFSSVGNTNIHSESYIRVVVGSSFSWCRIVCEYKVARYFRVVSCRKSHDRSSVFLHPVQQLPLSKLTRNPNWRVAFSIYPKTKEDCVVFFRDFLSKYCNCTSIPSPYGHKSQKEIEGHTSSATLARSSGCSMASMRCSCPPVL